MWLVNMREFKNSFFLILGISLFISTVFSQVPSPRPHPSYDNTNINPPTWITNDPNGYGGLAWLDDGRMVALEFVSQGVSAGNVQLLSGVLTANSGADITTETIATGLYQPLGVEVVGNTIYVIEKDQLSKIEPNGSSWDYSQEYNGHDPLIEENYGHWFSMGLLFHDAKFYWSLGGFYAYNNNRPTPERHGTVVEYDPVAGTHDFLVHGFRNTGGMALGPEGTICTNDNQGDWLPSSKVICIEAGNWYGYYGDDAQMRMGRQESPPTIWNTHQNMSSSRDYTGYGRSPGEMLMLKKGVFAGQMLMADITTAWLSRLFFEKVNGHWQGANFNFGGGFNSGAWRLLLAPDDETVIVAGLGVFVSGGWAYADSANNMEPTHSSLHRLVPNGTQTFEILAIRSMSETEMEVEFTMPANAAAGLPGNYDVSIWWNDPARGYGSGHKTDLQNINVTNVALSSDGTKATLSFAILDLYEGSVVRITIDPNNVKSNSGDDFWYWYGDYTLTNFGPADNTPVTPQPPTNLTYLQGTTLSYDLNQSVTANNLSYAGDPATNISIAPALPAGLSFSNSNGTISGTPSQLSPPTDYIVTVTNAVGSADLTINIGVYSTAPSNLVYQQGSNHIYQLGLPITENNLSYSGSQATSITIDPPLPAGLAFSSTGSISGSPSSITAAANYLVTVTNSVGSETITLNIETNVLPPSNIVYISGLTHAYPVNQLIVSNTLTYAGAPATSITISPNLPPGLQFSSDGTISGTPSAEQPATNYVVTVTNQAGTDSVVLSILVLGIAPSNVTYSQGTNLLYIIDVPITANVLTYDGSPATGFTINPSLPSGLSFNTTTGTISGTPTELATVENYLVEVTNLAGTTLLTIRLEVSTSGIVGVGLINPGEIPDTFELHSKFSNSHGGNNLLVFGVPSVNGLIDKIHISIVMHNIRGEVISTLVDGYTYPGYRTIEFKGNSDSGQKLSSGLYIISLISKGSNKSIKVYLDQ